MSFAIGHFAFGAAMTTILITIFLPTIWYPRTLVLLGGGWAMLPDLHQVSPIATEQLHSFHQGSIFMDLFWLHGTIDRLDPTDSSLVASVIVVFFLATTALAEHRNYRPPKPIKEAYEDHLDIDTTE